MFSYYTKRKPSITELLPIFEAEKTDESTIKINSGLIQNVVADPNAGRRQRACSSKILGMKFLDDGRIQDEPKTVDQKCLNIKQKVIIDHTCKKF